MKQIDKKDTRQKGIASTKFVLLFIGYLVVGLPLAGSLLGSEWMRKGSLLFLYVCALLFALSVGAVVLCTSISKRGRERITLAAILLLCFTILALYLFVVGIAESVLD